jgi:hypothetical protein
MNVTIEELSGSAEFWKRRCEEQRAYIMKYKSSTHTRPDYESVLASATYILDKCMANISHTVEESRTR